MTTIFAPHLFVRNISKNVTKDSLWEVFSNLGFGIIENIVVKPRAVKNNAIVYFQQWAMDETSLTRDMLQDGRALSITHEDDGSIWKVSAFDETRCGSVRNFTERSLHSATIFTERLLPNVTDNRAERERNAAYAVEFLDDLRRDLFPLDNINAPVNTLRSDINPLSLEEPALSVENTNSPVAIDYGEVRIPPKRRVVRK